MKQTSLAYAAGLIDSDGCIAIEKREPANYRLKVFVTNTDGRMLDWLKNNFGGHVRIHHKRVGNTNKQKSTWKDSWNWIKLGGNASKFLNEIYPYLVIKKQQAKIAILFCDTMTQGGRNTVTKKLLKTRKKHYQVLRKTKTFNVIPVSCPPGSKRYAMAKTLRKMAASKVRKAKKKK